MTVWVVMHEGILEGVYSTKARAADWIQKCHDREMKMRQALAEAFGTGAAFRNEFPRPMTFRILKRVIDCSTKDEQEAAEDGDR